MADSDDELYLADLPVVVHKKPEEIPIMPALIEKFDRNFSGMFKMVDVGALFSSNLDPQVNAMRAFGRGMTLEQLLALRDEVDALIEEKRERADNV